MMRTETFCQDCRFATIGEAVPDALAEITAECAHPRAKNELSPVTGRPLCQHLRYHGPCSDHANWFEPKTSHAKID